MPDINQLEWDARHRPAVWLMASKYKSNPRMDAMPEAPRTDSISPDPERKTNQCRLIGIKRVKSMPRPGSPSWSIVIESHPGIIVPIPEQCENPKTNPNRTDPNRSEPIWGFKPLHKSIQWRRVAGATLRHFLPFPCAKFTWSNSQRHK